MAFLPGSCQTEVDWRSAKAIQEAHEQRDSELEPLKSSKPALQ